MRSKSKPLTKTELAAYEAKRDLAADLLQSVREMKAGQLSVVSSPVVEARKKTGLSQSQFAILRACRFARCKVGSKAASSPAAPLARFSPLQAPIPRLCSLWRATSRHMEKAAQPFHRE